MSIWAWFFGKKKTAIAPPVIATHLPRPRAQLTAKDRDYVRQALDRFTGCGLRIAPDLNRDLIVARALVDAERWGFGPDRKPPSIGLDTEQDPIRRLFLVLAAETDSLTYHMDEMRELFPALSEMTEEDADDILQTHSYTIFDNADDIWMLNESHGMPEMVLAIADLTSGVVRIDDPWQILAGMRPAGKRPDVRPVIAKFNALTAGTGRFITMNAGNSDSDVVAFISEADVPRFAELLMLKPVAP